ncbi:TetR/AcrR family transcriptional regulator [Dactylosporangium aurantiacum]|uniref:TetR/AcrR family transcriptional regulator n=1 Tax=Dactylosporangium aurantiacum TaxID=35754 RepID=A0A9Q9MIT3_9ACTN|nr:TetR/AcrR family transcriptional regulator [Dactylosporangium aurantiacum]MDG6107230.1 TetR/AcrR family transcriptional regulator [Dactylosporangium aurantiacum]UWZ51237.1 TetR/AcrR family transcriptional regulator [Dactylosporangium aurantiacum]
MKAPSNAQLARAGRRDRIVAAAREIAEVDGWPAVTVRRLADTIGFSQPVLYGHFPDGRDGIIRAVALAGFARLAERMTPAGDRGDLRGLCAAYLDFARSQPATYEAMFALPTDLEFARPTTPEPLRAGFNALLSVMGDETRAEVLWSALHGLADLARHGRLRPDHEQARVDLLIELLRRDRPH